MPDVDDVLNASPLDPVSGPDATAEQLILLVHRGVNWDVWGPRRMTYWDALTSRIKAGTYAGRDLGAWWQDICLRIDSTPRSSADRRLVASLLNSPDQRAVLNALRDRSDMLVLRVRVAIEAHREAHPTASAPAPTAAPSAPDVVDVEPEPVG